VTLRLESGELLDAAYVIGADGARSVVRREAGHALEGPRDDTPFIIVDVDEHPDGSTPTSPAYFHYRMPEIGQRNVMHMPFAGGMRVDLQCRPDDDAGYLASPEGLREWLSPVVGDWHADHIQWVSTYRFHQAVADSFTDQHHRVLLAGEAAHLFAPWGGRGLNSGIIDATDAATAIGKAIHDPADATRHIQRCAADRRKWAIHNRDLSSRALRQMRADDPTMRVTRDLAARIAPAFPPAGLWLASAPIKPFVPWPWAKSHY
jgi:3-(3-hydroxy-phenyl)propionate hydroxylase